MWYDTKLGKWPHDSTSPKNAYDTLHDISRLRYLNEKFGFSKRLCASSIEVVKQRNKCMWWISLIRIALVVTTKTTSSTSSLQDMRRAFLWFSLAFLCVSLLLIVNECRWPSCRPDHQFRKYPNWEKVKSDGYCGHLRCLRRLHFYRKHKS